MKRRFPAAHLGRVALVLLTVWLLRRWIWLPLIVVGESMEPTLHSGQLAVANRLAFLFRPPRRGDIVVVWSGRDLIIKRIVGLPGEEIGACNGTFSVNGRPLEEPYIEFHDLLNLKPARIASDSFVIAGDNRAQTLIGLVNRERILGRLVMWSNANTGKPQMLSKQ
jgi:signal peptidase I